MFKVSFKENPKFPIKKVQRFNNDKVTIVTLKGVVKLPVFLQYFMPPKILEWMDTCKNVEAEVTMSRMYLTIKGKARRADNDVDNPVLGERIAECRAKVNLYRFMLMLCKQLYKYYRHIMYEGYIPEVNVDDSIYCTNDSIMASIYQYRRLYNSEEAHLKALLAHEPDTESSQKH